MDLQPAEPVTGAATGQWYARSAVDEFLDAAAQERTRLEAVIADANRRADQARAAMGLHHMMAAMLLETHRTLTERRHAAEAEAAQIILASEREAQALVDQAQAERPSSPSAEVIDLTGTVPTPGAPAAPPASAQENGQENGKTPATPDPVGAPDLATLAPRPHGNGDDSAEADAFFAYLRGSATDAEPLGPKPI